MKKVYKRALAVVLIVSVLVTASFCAISAQVYQNALGIKVVSGVLTYADDVAVQNDGSVKLTGTKTGQTYFQPAFGDPAKSIVLKPDTEYKIEFEYKLDSMVAGNTVMIAPARYPGDRTSYVGRGGSQRLDSTTVLNHSADHSDCYGTVALTTTTDGYVKYSATFKTPESLEFTNAAGTYTYDDFFIYAAQINSSNGVVKNFELYIKDLAVTELEEKVDGIVLATGGKNYMANVQNDGSVKVDGSGNGQAYFQPSFESDKSAFTLKANKYYLIEFEYKLDSMVDGNKVFFSPAKFCLERNASSYGGRGATLRLDGTAAGHNFNHASNPYAYNGAVTLTQTTSGYVKYSAVFKTPASLDITISNAPYAYDDFIIYAAQVNDSGTLVKNFELSFKNLTVTESDNDPNEKVDGIVLASGGKNYMANVQNDGSVKVSGSGNGQAYFQPSFESSASAFLLKANKYYKIEFEYKLDSMVDGNKVFFSPAKFCLERNTSGYAGRGATIRLDGTTAGHNFNHASNPYAYDGVVVLTQTTPGYVKYSAVFKTPASLDITISNAPYTYDDFIIYAAQVNSGGTLVKNFELYLKNLAITESDTGFDVDTVQIKFMTDGGSDAVTNNSVSMPVAELKNYTLPSTQKEGFEFCGWYTDAGLKDKFDPKTYEAEGGSITLYAKWLGKVVYKVDFNNPRLYYKNDALTERTAGAAYHRYDFVTDPSNASNKVAKYKFNYAEIKEDVFGAAKGNTTAASGIILYDPEAPATGITLNEGDLIKVTFKYKVLSVESGTGASYIKMNLRTAVPTNSSYLPVEQELGIVYETAPTKWKEVSVVTQATNFKTEGNYIGNGIGFSIAGFGELIFDDITVENYQGTAVAFETFTDVDIPLSTGKLGDKVKLPTVKKEGCVFEGWYTDPNFTNKYEGDSYTFGENADMLYAKYKAMQIKQDFENYKASGMQIWGDFHVNIPGSEGYDVDYVRSGDGSVYRKGEEAYTRQFTLFDPDTPTLEIGQKYILQIWVRPIDLFVEGSQLCIRHCSEFDKCYSDQVAWAALGYKETDYNKIGVGKQLEAIANCDDLRLNEWNLITYEFTALTPYLAIAAPEYNKIAFDDCLITLKDAKGYELYVDNSTGEETEKDDNKEENKVIRTDPNHIFTSTIAGNMLGVILGIIGGVVVIAAGVLVFVFRKKIFKKSVK